MRGAIISLLILMATSALVAQENYNDFVIQESRRYKTGGIAMAIGGLGMIAGSVAVLTNETSEQKVGGIVMAASGVALDVGSIFMFRKSKQVLEDAHAQESAPMSFYIKPNGVQFVARF